MAVAANRQVQDAALDTYAYVGDLTTERVGRFAEFAESAVVTTALQITRGDESPSNDELLNSLYQRMLASPDIRAMYIGWPDGSVGTVERDGGGYLARYTSAPGEVTSVRYDSVFTQVGDAVVVESTYDPRTRPWYIAGEQGQHIEWTDPYVAFEGDAALVSVALAARERPTGDPVAVVGADLSLDALGEVLSDLPLGAGAEAFVLSATSQVIAVPDARTEEFENYVIANDSVPYADDLGIATSGRPEGNDTVEFSSDGDVMILDQTFPSTDNVDWYVHMTADDSQLSSGLGGLSNMLGWIALYSFAVTVLAALLVWRVRRPLRRVHSEASRDPLTGLINRAEFFRRGTRLLDRAAEQGDAVVATVLDLDNFKALNDTAGHDAGDSALLATSEAMRASTRGRDVAARFGGDEFVTLHVVRHVDDGFALAERLREAIEEQIHRQTPGSSDVGVTAGIALVGPDTTLDLGELLTRADSRLVRGKRIAKGCVYGPDQDDDTPSEL